MFTDTHCHFVLVKERGIDLNILFDELAQKNTPFVLDAGSLYNDLEERLLIKSNIQKTGKNTDFLHFAAGIWPRKDAIENRFMCVAETEKLILAAQEKKEPIVAYGECGIDRNANKESPQLLHNEEELFEMQIKLAQKLNLPIITHSRDAFESTYACIKNCAYNNGVIHCYSYGIKEAKAFLDLGWYISFSGAITYAKKQETTGELLNYIPKDRLLLETDAPYLAPVPFRGKTNTPLLIEHTYAFCADLLNIPLNELAKTVTNNAKRLFLKA